MSRGSRLRIVGRVTKADLARIKGSGTVYIAESDLPASTHERGKLTVVVRPPVAVPRN